MEQKKKTKKLNILYRVIPLVCSLAIAFIGIMPIKAYAAQFPITNYQTSVEEYTTFTLVNYSFPENLVRWSGYQDHAGVANIIQQGGFTYSLSGDQIAYDEYTIDNQYYSDFQVDVLFRPQGNNFISTDDLGGGTFTYNYNATPSIKSLIQPFTYSIICYIQVNMSIRYYDDSLSEISNRQHTGVVYKQYYNHMSLPSSFPRVNIPLSLELNVPVDAAYFQPYVYTRFFFSGYNTVGGTSFRYPYISLVLNTNSGSMKIPKTSGSPSIDGIGDIVDQNNDMINQNQQIIGGQNTIIDQNQQMLGNQNTIKDQNQQMINNQNAIKDQINNVDSSIKDSTDRVMNGDSDMVDKVGDSVNDFQQSDQKLNDLTDDLKVNQPSIDPEDVAVENIVDAAMMPIFTAPLMQLWESPIIVTVLTVVLTLVLISFVFFGKKG